MTTKYKIGWERWIDPYGTNIEEFAWPMENDGDIDKAFNDTDLDTYDEEFNLDNNKPVVQYPIKLLRTSMGILPLYEHSLPSHVFKLFTAHTNFVITGYISNLISSIAGVESLDVLSPYK